MSFVKSIILFIRRPGLIKGFQALFALFLVYFALLLLHYHLCLITFPYPINYREAPMMATTVLLLHGINPYNFVFEPQYSNLYGIVYPLIALPWVKLFGESLICYRTITAFFILTSCLVIFLVLYKKKTPLLLNFWAVLTLYASLLFPLTSTPCVDPGSMGLFFMLLTVFIPFFFDYSPLSFLVSIIFGLLAFYTKPYFFLGLPVIISYVFIFISKKGAVFFGFWALACLALSMAAINHLYPSYFDDCFFVNYNHSAETSMMIVLESQLHRFAYVHKGIIFLLSAMCVFSAWRWLATGPFKDLKGILKVCTNSIRWMDWNDPLITHRLPLDIYTGICFADVLVVSMGRHLGANLWYFFQLFSPFLLIFVAWITGRFRLWPVLFSSLLIYNLYLLSADDRYQYFDKKSTKGWDIVSMLVKSGNSIFHSSLIAPLLIQDNKEIFDDGTECYPEGGQRHGWPAHFLKEDTRVGAAQAIFLNKVQTLMRTKKFDLILLEAGYSSDVMNSSMSNYYKYVGPVLVAMPQDRKYFLITVWRPN